MELNDLKTLDKGELIGLIKSYAAARQAFPPDAQAFLATHRLVAVRRAMALRGVLDLATTTTLVGDKDGNVVSALADNQHAALPEDLQLRLIELYRAGRAVGALGSLLVTSSFESVQLEILEAAEAAYATRMLQNNPHVASPTVWRAITDRVALAAPRSIPSDEWSRVTHVLFLLAGRPDLMTLPDFVRTPVLTSSNLRVQMMLASNSEVPLHTGLLSAALLSATRGVEFLDELGPLDRSAWNALLPTWEGSVDELLAASEHFAPA